VDHCLEDRGDFLSLAASIHVREASEDAFAATAHVEGLGPEGAHAMRVALARTD
jgi:hypothetical protein